jgi:hypothetical protein
MAVNISADLGPLRAFTERLEHSVDKMRREVARGLYAAGEEVMTASKEIVPVDTGALKSTGVVLQPVISGDRIDVLLGYGGPARNKTGKDVGYAWYVHENLEGHHFHGNGQAKYLERPLMEKVADIARKIAGGLINWSRL